MRYLSLDFGSKRIGLAMCDPTEVFVSPICQLEYLAKNPALFVEQLRRVLDDYQIEAIVVGLPLNMDDTLGPQARQTQAFVAYLKSQISLPIHLHDERLSSAAADEMLAIGDFTKKKHKQRRDMLAACAILQEFLANKTK